MQTDFQCHMTKKLTENYKSFYVNFYGFSPKDDNQGTRLLESVDQTFFHPKKSWWTYQTLGFLYTYIHILTCIIWFNVILVSGSTSHMEARTPSKLRLTEGAWNTVQLIVTIDPFTTGVTCVSKIFLISTVQKGRTILFL